MSIEEISVESKEELEQMVTKEMKQIEKELTVVCNHVPMNDKTTLDILCHDNDGQLVVLQLNVKEDDNMLLQGIQSLDYIEKFRSFLKATYSKYKIDGKEKPRLILVAPSFSETLHHTVEHMQGIHIDLYEWEYLKIGDHKGLRLQPIFTGKPPEKPEEKEKTKPAEKKHPKKPENKEEQLPEMNEEPEPAIEEEPKFPTPFKKPEEEKDEFKPDKKKEPPKKKHRLF